ADRESRAWYGLLLDRREIPGDTETWHIGGKCMPVLDPHRFSCKRVELRDVFERVCHVVGLDRNESAVGDRLGSNARGGAPCLEGLGPEPTLRCRCDEMATDVESVVDRSMC